MFTRSRPLYDLQSCCACSGRRICGWLSVSIGRWAEANFIWMTTESAAPVPERSDHTMARMSLTMRGSSVRTKWL